MNNEQKKLASENLRVLRGAAENNYNACSILAAHIFILCGFQILLGIGVVILAFKLPNNTSWQLAAFLLGGALMALGILGMVYLPYVPRNKPEPAEKLQRALYQYGLEEVPQVEEAREEVKSN